MGKECVGREALKMVRLHMVVEGQTEETFVRSLLVEYLGSYNISTDVRLVETGRHRATIYKGGMTTYAKLRKDLGRWLAEDRNPDARFTTMFDLYRLPKDFPDHDKAESSRDPYDRIRILEDAFGTDIGDRRLVPYIQLHEFEALLFANIAKFEVVFVGAQRASRNLQAIREAFSSPELIDDGATTAPSKRIISEIPAYEGQKSSAGPLIASAIGLPTLRRECRHFSNWLEKLEALGDASI
jgi:hypothetical protein